LKIRILVILALLMNSLYAVKVKEIANVIGVRDNQLIGYGLVVGLNGTGDGSSSTFTKRAVASMLRSVDVNINPRDVKSKNVAAVMVTAKLPAFSKHGDKIDIEVASIGDAKSIKGGTLLMTPLKGVDGLIYALAQGQTPRGYTAPKKRVTKRTMVKIYGGALVERELGFDLYNKNSISLSMKKSDFTSAVNIQNRLNLLYGASTAVALDSRTIKITRPSNMSMVEFLAKINETDVNYTKTQKIVIDEKTGTVVAGVNILVQPVVVTHGDLTLKIESASSLPQTDPDQYYENASVDTHNNIIKMRYGTVTVANITRVLQKLGSKPDAIIAIIETIKRSGAIEADLEII
jgi:flagellar P-ring protein precursor FlgI